MKVFLVAVVGLALLIPLAMVERTLDERAARRAEAVTEITRTWGDVQHVLGPVLVVPFSYRVTTEETVVRNGVAVRERVVQTKQAEAFFLPDDFEAGASFATSERQRGIHHTDVYVADLKLRGRFGRPDFSFIRAEGVEPQWHQARLVFGFSDLRGARTAIHVGWNGTTREAQPGTRIDALPTGVQVPVPLTADNPSGEFSLDLSLNGSGGLFIFPSGRTSRLRMNSAWPDPSFAGASLPTSRTVTPEGFSAAWELSYYGRNHVPPSWSSLPDDGGPTFDMFRGATVGVSLFEVVNAYRLVERAIKHGVLFIALVFAAFFLFETFARVRLHGLNYLLVGGALCLFYLTLLALSEFAAFAVAYAAAAASSVALIGLYAVRILERKRRAAGVSLLLAAVYAYLYFVLHMEEYALLAGTAALFVLLAALMYATRRLNGPSSLFASRPVPPPVPMA